MYNLGIANKLFKLFMFKIVSTVFVNSVHKRKYLNFARNVSIYFDNQQFKKVDKR